MIGARMKLGMGLGLIAWIALWAAPNAFSVVNLPENDPATPGGIGVEPHAAERPGRLLMSTGRIERVDPAHSTLEVSETNPRNGKDRDVLYAISEQKTTVTDPKDKLFLKLGDLEPGQVVSIQYVADPKADKRLAQTITVFGSDQLRWTVGQVVSYNPTTGVFLLRETAPGPAATHPVVFVIRPGETSVMNLTQRQVMRLTDLRPGDQVQVVFAPSEEGNLTRSILVLQPQTVLAEPADWMTGAVEYLDLRTGTLVLKAAQPRFSNGRSVPLIIHPTATYVTSSASNVRRLEDLRPGDIVRVKFSFVGDERFARAIDVQ